MAFQITGTAPPTCLWEGQLSAVHRANKGTGPSVCSSHSGVAFAMDILWRPGSPFKSHALEQREPGWGKVAFWSPSLTGQDRGREQRFLKPPRQQRLLTSRSCAARSVLGSWQVGGVVRAEVTPSRVSHSSFLLLQQPGSQLFPMRWLQNVGSLDP